MKSLRFLSPAENEMLKAARYYESKCSGLGCRFLGEVERTTEAISANPRAGAIFRRNIRRRLLPHFPFSLLYSISNEEILVVAVMDLRRDPEYWINRL
ncbi:MAG TPA: type II toxin-antitoxin system RelE/ParE family toxin [Candidatus Hydrogenedentes bacterium]|nr:type II toxin-antitoxin system RelE/ParE family toxin [Candidatus Hydrogenedentota bacterium]